VVVSGRAATGAAADRRAALVMGALPMFFLFALFLYPVIRFLTQSLEGGSLAHYEKALTDRLYVAVLLDTLRIALVVTVVCLVLGYPVAHFIATAPRLWAAIALALLLLPFWTSVLVRTYAWMILLGRSGLVNRALMSLGIVDEPLRLLFNEIGVIVGMVHVLLPYMVFPIMSVMRRVDGQVLAAAEGLGASPLQSFRRVYFPLTLPGVLAGTTLVFVVALGFFITPALLGGGRVIMIGVLIEEQVRKYLDWGFAAALSVVLFAAALAVYALFRRVMREDMRWS
jgi:putative spermidine/putrescine transport system permease protein